MSNNQLELGDSTLRQRRNLMLITMVLIFMRHGQVTFGADVKILGASAAIGNPDIVLPFLFIVQAYFLWRFYQYFHTDGAYSELKNQYSGSLKNALDSSTLQQIFKELPDGITSLSGSYSYTKLEKSDSNYYQVEVETPSASGVNPEKFSVKVPKSPIERKRFTVLIGFAFRGRILTDFLLPYLLVVYSVLIYVV